MPKVVVNGIWSHAIKSMLTTTCYLFNLLPNDGMTHLKVVFNQIISQSFSLPSPIICPKKKFIQVHKVK